MPPVGLKNLGSTGYLNVVIQMHLHQSGAKGKNIVYAKTPMPLT